jgi:hypothetical protein
MFADSSINRVMPRTVVVLFTIVVEAALVIGLVLVILAPGTVGGQVGSPDRPPAPLVAPLRT